MLDGAVAAQQRISMGSLGFCGSAWWGGEEEGVIKLEREQSCLYFLLRYGLLQFGSLLEGWNVSCGVWSLQKDSVYLVLFCVGFITCVM